MEGFQPIHRMVLMSDLNRGEEEKFVKVTPVQHGRNPFVFGKAQYNDRILAQLIAKIVHQFDSPVIFSYPLRFLSEFESTVGLVLKDSFTSYEIAMHKLHGIGHTTRVIFWIMVLSEMMDRLDYPIDPGEKIAAAHAGFYHDLARLNDWEYANHGQDAVDRFGEEINRAFSDDIAIRCKNAIACHSRDEDPQIKDNVWMLLKDADALDRGRFGDQNSPDGCNRNLLRLDLFYDDPDLTSYLLLAAHYLAKVTENISWSKNSCKDLADTITSSLRRVVDFTSGDDAEWLQDIRRILCNL